MIHSDWKSCTITTTTSDTTSAEVDLEKPYEELEVYIPTLTSSTLALHVSETAGGTYSAAGNSVTIPASTGGYFDIWHLGGNQHIKIVCGSAQAANRTFRVRGVRS